ncbi:hypothetical protein E6O75_ATG08495 [Venturia nashicola]|uniref:Uncharacterized protein n=1 Tax=Venturia nashicola TaxID=86259 RepID=A0A4Z1NVE0_9PEZI|nr:hypothetical protein E6O75_ATG08495 [Venturia nashicola]
MPRIIHLIGDLTQSSKPIYPASLKQDPNKKSFLDLQRELRDLIYEIAVDDDASEAEAQEKEKRCSFNPPYGTLFLLSEQFRAEFAEAQGKRWCLSLGLSKNSKEVVYTKGKQVPSLTLRFTTCFMIRIAEIIPTKCVQKRNIYIETQSNKLGNALRGALSMYKLGINMKENKSITSLGGPATHARRVALGKRELEKSDHMCNAMVAHMGPLPKLGNLRVWVWSNYYVGSYSWGYSLNNGTWTAYDKSLLDGSREWVGWHSCTAKNDRVSSGVSSGRNE